MGQEMQARGRNRRGQFWWRAAEPIPARPVPLAPMPTAEADHAEPDPGSVAEPAAAAQPSAPHASRSRPDGQRPVADLGAVRPNNADDLPAADHVAPAFGAEAGARWLERGADLLPVRANRRWRRADARVATWSLFGKRHALLAASVAGALLFAASTGFGRHVRPMQSLVIGIDRMLVGAGLGINETTLSGQHYTTDSQIYAALDRGGASLLFFDVEAARARIEKLPWIESATLIRVLPDKLKVEVRERRPAALWLDGDRAILVDLTGHMLARVAISAAPELPRVAGRGAPAAAAELLSALAGFSEIAARLQVAHRVGERRWDLELTGATRVLMAAGPSLTSLQRLVELDRETQVLEVGKQVVDLTQVRSIAVSTSSETDVAVRRTNARSPARPL